MVYRKGELSRRQVLRDWPHQVLTPTPPNGFGQMLNAMHAFCAEAAAGTGRDYHTASAYASGKPDGCY